MLRLDSYLHEVPAKFKSLWHICISSLYALTLRHRTSQAPKHPKSITPFSHLSLNSHPSINYIYKSHLTFPAFPFITTICTIQCPSRSSPTKPPKPQDLLERKRKTMDIEFHEEPCNSARTIKKGRDIKTPKNDLNHPSWHHNQQATKGTNRRGKLPANIGTPHTKNARPQHRHPSYRKQGHFRRIPPPSR